MIIYIAICNQQSAYTAAIGIYLLSLCIEYC